MFFTVCNVACCVERTGTVVLGRCNVLFALVSQLLSTDRFEHLSGLKYFRSLIGDGGGKEIFKKISS